MSMHIRIVDAFDQHDANLSTDRKPVLFVVDDDVLTVELLRDIAQDLGWVAIGFTRISELMAALDKQPPTVLILDDDLVDGRGGDLARDLRDDPSMADVALLVCTAAHPMRTAEIGAWAPVISKPFDLAEIEGFLQAAERLDGRARGERSG